MSALSGWSARFLTSWSETALRRVEIPSAAAPHIEEITMLNWAITFLVIALIAGVLGFGGIAGTAAGFAKIVFFVALVLMLLSFLRGRTSGV